MPKSFQRDDSIFSKNSKCDLDLYPEILDHELVQDIVTLNI